jgi:TetR/AcrR family transcriptional regulator, mexJK operon transcriptional repressor
MDPTRRPRPRASGPGRLPATAQAHLPERLLDAALAVFMREGYARATMADIAAAAGTTRKTLYARHANKTEVLAAVVNRLLDAALAEPAAPSHPPLPSAPRPVAPGPASAASPTARQRRASAGEPRAVLQSIATELALLSVSPEVVGLNRLILAEAGRAPALADLFLDLHARAVAVVQAQLASLQRAGLLRRPAGGARAAAGLFVEMSCSLPRLRALLGRPMSQDELRTHVQAAVGQFLAAHAPLGAG